jgi:hypothetical protein
LLGLCFELICFCIFRSSEGSSDTESDSSSASDSSSGDKKADRHVSGRKKQADNKTKKNLGIYLILTTCAAPTNLPHFPHT